MMLKKHFIVFEGIEGWKIFSKQRLYRNLKKKNIRYFNQEPGGTKSAELIRDLILKDYFNKKNDEKFDRYTDTSVFSI